MATSAFVRVLTIRSVPPPIIVLAALTSCAGQVLAGLKGWPLWARVLAALVPWVALLSREIPCTFRHCRWLAVFYVLALSEVGHVLEHAAQMVQLHVLHLDSAHAHGIFGALDIEWVHFFWNTWILLAVVVLLSRFRNNPWLWATLVIAGWHEVEHAFILSAYLSAGVAGTPGLLAAGGRISGGLPIARPDLHFLYNLIETAPLVAGFILELNRSYTPERRSTDQPVDGRATSLHHDPPRSSATSLLEEASKTAAAGGWRAASGGRATPPPAASAAATAPLSRLHRPPESRPGDPYVALPSPPRVKDNAFRGRSRRTSGVGTGPDRGRP